MPIDAAAFWTRIGDVGKYREWWPWLRQFDASALAPGAVWQCAVRPQLPYTVRFTVMVEAVAEARSISVTIDGDIAGSALLEIAEAEGGCQLRLTSRLRPSSIPLRWLSVVPPLARWGHNWVLDTGARQFAAEVG